MNILDQASLLDAQDLRALIQELEVLADEIDRVEELEYDLIELHEELLRLQEAEGDTTIIEAVIEDVREQLEG